MGSKYDDLVKAVADARKRDAEAFVCAVKLGTDLVNALRVDLGPPEQTKGALTLLPIDPVTGLYSTTGEKPPFSKTQLFRIDEANRYHVGLMVSIGAHDDQPARLLFHLMIEQIDGTKYGVRYAETLPAVEVDIEDAATHGAFTTAIFETILKHYNDEPIVGGPYSFSGDPN